VAKLLQGLGVDFTRQVYANGGYADFFIRKPRILIECKTTFTSAAFSQLVRYSEQLRNAALVCMCKQYQEFTLPQGVVFRTIDELLEAKPNQFTIIPWTGKYA